MTRNHEETPKMARFPYNDAFLCLMLLAALIVASYYMAGWAFGAEAPDNKPVPLPPGWILCMGSQTGKIAACRMFQQDGPAPVLSMPGEVIKK